MGTETNMSCLTMSTDMNSLDYDDSEATWCAYWSDKYQRAYYHESKSDNVSWKAPDSYRNRISASSIETDKRRNNILGTDSCTTMSTTTSDHQESIATSCDTPTRDTTDIWCAKDFIPSPHEILRHSISIRKRVATRRRLRRKNVIWTAVVTCAALISGIVGTSCYAYKKENATFYKDDLNKTLPYIKTELLSSEGSVMSKSIVFNIASPKTKPMTQEVYSIDSSSQNYIINILDSISKVVALHESSHADELITKTNSQELAPSIEDYSLILCCSIHESSTISNIDSSQQIHRPHRCYIPFSYLFSKECDYLSKQIPLYSAKDLVDSMMQ